VHMELGGKLLNSLRIKTQFFERLQSVSVVDGATHTQKDDVESNGGSLEKVAEVFVLLLCNVYLVLRSGVLTILDLDEVDVTPSFAEAFRSVLSGVGGSTGGWRIPGYALPHARLLLLRVGPVKVQCIAVHWSSSLPKRTAPSRAHSLPDTLSLFPGVLGKWRSAFGSPYVQHEGLASSVQQDPYIDAPRR